MPTFGRAVSGACWGRDSERAVACCYTTARQNIPNLALPTEARQNTVLSAGGPGRTLFGPTPKVPPWAGAGSDALSGPRPRCSSFRASLVG